MAVVTLGKCLDEGLAKFAEARQRGCPNDHQALVPISVIVQIRNHSVSTIPCATMYVGNERWAAPDGGR